MPGRGSREPFLRFYGSTEGNGALVNVCRSAPPSLKRLWAVRKSDLVRRGAVGRGGAAFDFATGLKWIEIAV